MNQKSYSNTIIYTFILRIPSILWNQQQSAMSGGLNEPVLPAPFEHFMQCILSPYIVPFHFSHDWHRVNSNN